MSRLTRSSSILERYSDVYSQFESAAAYPFADLLFQFTRYGWLTTWGRLSNGTYRAMLASALKPCHSNLPLVGRLWSTLRARSGLLPVLMYPMSFASA